MFSIVVTHSTLAAPPIRALMTHSHHVPAMSSGTLHEWLWHATRKLNIEKSLVHFMEALYKSSLCSTLMDIPKWRFLSHNRRRPLRVFHVFLETILCDHLDHHAFISISRRPIHSQGFADDIDLMIANPNIAFYDFFLTDLKTV